MKQFRLKKMRLWRYNNAAEIKMMNFDFEVHLSGDVRIYVSKFYRSENQKPWKKKLQKKLK